MRSESIRTRGKTSQSPPCAKVGSSEIVSSSLPNKIESILLLDQFKGASTAIPVSDFNNFLKHLDEKILFNQLDESIAFSVAAEPGITESQLRASLIEQSTQNDFIGTKMRKLVFFINKLDIEEHVKMRMMTFTEEAFEGIRHEVDGLTATIDTLQSQLAAHQRGGEEEKKKLAAAMVSVNEKELRLVEFETELQNVKQRYLKIEMERNHMKLDYETKLNEAVGQITKQEGFLDSRNQEVIDLQKRISELLNENADLNQLNEHRRKTLDQMQLNKDVQRGVELVRLQAENQGLHEKMAELNSLLEERDKEFEAMRATSQKEIEEVRALCARYAERVTELENKDLPNETVNQSLDIKSSIVGNRRQDSLSPINYPGKDSFDLKAMQTDEEITILNGFDQPIRKEQSEIETELAKAKSALEAAKVALEAAKAEHTEAMNKLETRYGIETRQLVSEKQTVMEKLNEMMIRNIQDSQKIKELEVQCQGLNTKIDRLNERLLNEENSVKFLRGENQKLHDELKKSIPLPMKASIAVSVSKRVLQISGTKNYFKLTKGHVVDGNYNFAMNKQKPAAPELQMNPSAQIKQGDDRNAKESAFAVQTKPEFNSQNVNLPNQFKKGGNVDLTVNAQSIIFTPSEQKQRTDTGKQESQFSVLNQSQTAKEMSSFLDSLIGEPAAVVPQTQTGFTQTNDNKYSLNNQPSQMLRPGAIKDTQAFQPTTPAIKRSDAGAQNTPQKSFGTNAQMSQSQAEQSANKNSNPSVKERMDEVFKRSWEAQQSVNQLKPFVQQSQGIQNQSGVGQQTSQSLGIQNLPTISAMHNAILKEEDFDIFQAPAAKDTPQTSKPTEIQQLPPDAMKKKLSTGESQAFLNNLTEKQKRMFQSFNNITDVKQPLAPNSLQSMPVINVPRTPELSSKTIADQAFNQKFSSASVRNAPKIFEDQGQNTQAKLVTNKQTNMSTQQPFGYRHQSIPNLNSAQQKDVPLPLILPNQPANKVYPDIPLTPQRQASPPRAKSEIGRRMNKSLPRGLKQNIDFSEAVVNRIKQLKSRHPERHSVSNLNRYSYNHLNMDIFMVEGRYVLKEASGRVVSNCFSDIVNRMNKWEKKSEKYIIILNDNLYLFNTDRKLKKRYPIRIKHIKRIDVNMDSNFFCIVDAHGQFEVLESIRKEELINFILKQATAINHQFSVSKVTRMCFENSERQRVVYNPADVKKYKPHWTPAFNYAQKHTCMSYAKRDPENLTLLESIFDQKDKCLLILTNLAILVLTTIEFNIRDAIPLVRVKVFERDKDIVLTMSDGTKKMLSFFSELDKNIWATSIKDAIKALEK